MDTFTLCKKYAAYRVIFSAMHCGLFCIDSVPNLSEVTKTFVLTFPGLGTSRVSREPHYDLEGNLLGCTYLSIRAELTETNGFLSD